MTTDLYGFLTTEANAIVGAVHPKAIPVILTEPEEWKTWLTEPFDKAKTLQRPLPEGVLEMVAQSERRDGAGGVGGVIAALPRMTPRAESRPSLRFGRTAAIRSKQA